LDSLVSIDVSAVPPQPKGVGRYAIEMLKALGPLVHPELEVGLCVSRSNAELFYSLGSNVAVLCESPANRLARLTWEQSFLPFLLNRTGVRLHHGIHYTAPLLYRGIRVVTVHDVTFITSPQWHEPEKVQFFSRALRWAARNTDAIVVPSFDTANKLKILLSPTAEVVVIPHGVKTTRCRGYRDNYTDRSGSPFILFVGTVEPRKSVETLVMAFDEIAGEFDSLRLVIAGQIGWRADKAKTAISNSPFRSRIDLLGFVSDDELERLYNQASVFVYPSLEEGFGLPVLEAMAHHVPVVTTRDSAMAEVSEGYASLVSAGDVLGLASEISKELTSPRSRKELTDKACNLLASYTWERSARGHLALYETLLRG